MDDLTLILKISFEVLLTHEIQDWQPLHYNQYFSIYLSVVHEIILLQCSSFFFLSFFFRQ